MLPTALVVLHDQVVDAEAVLSATLEVVAVPASAPRGLLVQVISVEDHAFRLAYSAMVAYALAIDPTGSPCGVDLLHPLHDLLPHEQRVLRTALIRQSWPAWARATPHLRSMLGFPDPPVRLADAARQTGMPLATLANAAVRERLPTIQWADRHLVYLATLSEALDRGVLHLQRGRPKRQRS